MQINHRINPRNDLERMQVRAIEVASEILCEALGVEITLQAQRQPGWAGSDAFHCGMYVYRDKHGKIDNTLKINFRNLTGSSTRTVLMVLGHEFRHAVQHQKEGFYDKTRFSRQWIGPAHPLDAKPNHARQSYWNDPCEIDARAFQGQYADLVINHPKFAEFKDSLNIEGNVPMKKDMDATYAKYGITRAETQLFAPSKELTCYVTLSQIGAKKFSPKVCRSVWSDHRELMMSQPFEYVMVPCELYDLIN